MGYFYIFMPFSNLYFSVTLLFLLHRPDLVSDLPQYIVVFHHPFANLIVLPDIAIKTRLVRKLLWLVVPDLAATTGLVFPALAPVILVADFLAGIGIFMFIFVVVSALLSLRVRAGATGLATVLGVGSFLVKEQVIVSVRTMMVDSAPILGMEVVGGIVGVIHQCPTMKLIFDGIISTGIILGIGGDQPLLFVLVIFARNEKCLAQVSHE